MLIWKQTRLFFYASVLVVVVLSCFPTVSFGQDSAGGKRSPDSAPLAIALRQAFESNDHAAISGLFGASVELQLPNVSGIFSKKQSDMIMGQFMSLHQGFTCELDHEEVSDDATLVIGRISKGGEAFRICILAQQYGDLSQIKQLRIETLK